MVGQSGDQIDDDASILPDTRVLRRIPPGRVAKKTPTKRPQTDNFKNSRDDTGTSVSVWEKANSPDKVLRGHKGFGLVSLTVGDIRDAGLGIVRAPNPEDPHHAHIQGKKTGAAKRGLAKAAVWISRPADTNR